MSVWAVIDFGHGVGGGCLQNRAKDWCTIDSEDIEELCAWTCNMYTDNQNPPVILDTIHPNPFTWPYKTASR